MSETLPFTIESFYKMVGQRRLMAAKCKRCGSLHAPPRLICTKCYANQLEWVELGNKGKLLTYTVIHVSPKQFESLIPYAVGIVKLEDGPQLPGMIRGVDPDKIRVGMDLTVDFDTTLPPQWPTWPRYHFKPA